MGSPRSRRHHYNPQMLLKNFCDDGGLLWMGERTGGKFVSSTPKNAFVINDLNASYNFPRAPRIGDKEEFFGSIEKSDKYERLLSLIESEAAPVVWRVIEQARRKQHPQLSEEDAKKLKRFILAMARRNPESQKRIATGKSFDDVLWNILKVTVEKENLPGLPERAVFDQDPDIAELEDMVRSNVNAVYAAGDHPRERNREKRFCPETGLYVLSRLGQVG